MSDEIRYLMEDWQSYLNEEAEPTVHDFIQAMAQYKGKELQKILGISGKILAAIAAGALISTGAGAAGAAVGTAAVGALGQALGNEAIGQIMSKFAEKSGALSKWMYARMRAGGLPDDQRKPVDAYFDIDDEMEAVIKGGSRDSPLFKEFSSQLFNLHRVKLAAMDDPSDLNKPLKDFIEGTADQYLKAWLNSGKLGADFKGIKIDKGAELTRV